MQVQPKDFSRIFFTDLKEEQAPHSWYVSNGENLTITDEGTVDEEIQLDTNENKSRSGTAKPTSLSKT